MRNVLNYVFNISNYCLICHFCKCPSFFSSSVVDIYSGLIGLNILNFIFISFWVSGLRLFDCLAFYCRFIVIGVYVCD